MDKLSFHGTCFPEINNRTIQDGVYIISTNAFYNSVLSIVGKSTQADSSVNFSKKTREAHQFFFIKYDEQNESYTIMALNSHLYLGVDKKEDSNYNNTFILQNSNSPNRIIHWKIFFDDGYLFQLNGYDYNMQYMIETKIAILAQKNDSKNQRFSVKPFSVFSSGLYYIYSMSPDKSYITFSKNEEEKSYLSSRNESNDQLFYVFFDEFDGCYSIININNLKCFSPGINPQPSSELEQTAFYNADYQKWIIGTYDCKSYFIMLKSDLLLLCNPIIKNSEKQNLCLKEYNNTLTFNFNYQFQSLNDSLFKKVKSTFSLQFLSYRKQFKEIEEKARFRYCSKISASYLTRMAQRMINNQLFENNFILNYLEIPLSVIEIHERAFKNCLLINFIKCHPKWLKFLPNPINVENIAIPEGVELIENDTFTKFTNVKYLSIPNSLKFENCDPNIFNAICGLQIFEGDPIFLNIIKKDNLTTVNIPFFVKVIPQDICAGCELLSEVNIEENSMLQIIQPRAFAGCKSLRFMLIPESVINISPDAFNECNDFFELELKNRNQEMSKTESLVINPNVPKITNDYKSYINITTIEIPNEVQECDPQVLESFEKLKTVKCDPKWLNNFNTNKIENVSIPENITELKKRDFQNLVHLKFIEIPESVQEIENGTFDNCEEISSVKCGTHHFKFLNKKKIKSVCLNDQVEYISETDFEEFINLEICKIPKSINEINPRAFINCKKLMEVDHPNGKLLINNYVSIDENITEVSKEDFVGWTNLKKLIIPNSVMKIEKDAFKDCINLKSLTCDPKWFPFIPKNSIKKIVIPSFVKEIKKGQFDDFNSLTYIKLPNDIQINDPTIFDSCENLTIIRCKSSIFNTLTDKAIERCGSKLKTKYENPVFNFQPDRSKVHDETDIIPTDDLDATSSLSLTNISFSSLMNVKKNANMTIDELVSIDGPNVNPYKRGICNVLWCIQSGEVNYQNKPNDTTIYEISCVCGEICYKISERLKIIPRVVQIYAILRLANEILNKPESKGSIGEIKPGEGKSLIMAVLTIILVKYNRTVDITTSNLKLAKRYKSEQKQFFDLFNIPTDVFYDRRNDSDFLTNSMISTLHGYSNNFEEYDQSEYNKFNIKAFNCPVVYSTNRNFEYYYLHYLFNMIPRNREFDVVLVDGVDNMLIDEMDSPATISKEINYSFSPNIICIVFAARKENISEIRKMLKQEFPNVSDFNEKDVEMLKNAAYEAIRKKINVDYIKEDNKIVIIDHDTGNKMPASHWPNYVLQMVEIKESIVPRPISLSFCQITQQAYFKLYKKIAGITGTIGSENDENILKEGYEVDTFIVPRNIPLNIEVFYKNRPESMDEVFNRVYDEINFEVLIRKRPVLIIWDTKSNAENFIEYHDLSNVGCIFGDDQNADEKAIESAGKLEALTITTSAAIREIDIMVTNEALEAGGLHIVIPMKIFNIRTLEHHFAIAGRQGQPGSVTLFISKEDQYIQTQSFNQKNINLDILQNLFVNDIKDNLPWMLCGPREYNFGEKTEFPFAASYSDIFNILSRRIFLIINEAQISNGIDLFKDLSWIMVQTAWESFFTNIKNDDLNNNSINYCKQEYNQFKRELNNFLSFEKSKEINTSLNFLLSKFINQKDYEQMIYKGFKISSSAVTLIPTTNRRESNEELSQNQKNNSFLSKIANAFAANYHRIPGTHLLNKMQNVEVSNEITDINFIRMAMNLAKESYDGKFSINRVIFASETNDLYKPKFYCIENLNRLFVVTRGSASDEDWVTDFTCEEVSDEINGTKIYFHKGFFMAANYILSNIIELIERNYKKIYFVGHSYAAAVSNVLCLLTKMHPKFKTRNIFSLAFAPPPSMSKVPAYVQDCMFSFINKKDIIPHLSLNNIKNTVSFEGTSVKEFIESKLKYIKALSIASEYARTMYRILSKYKTHIYSVLDFVDNEFHVHKNIGNIFIIGLRNSTKLKNYKVHESDLNDVLFLVPSIISDHYIYEYIYSFEIIESYE